MEEQLIEILNLCSELNTKPLIVINSVQPNIPVGNSFVIINDLHHYIIIGHYELYKKWHNITQRNLDIRNGNYEPRVLSYVILNYDYPIINNLKAIEIGFSDEWPMEFKNETNMYCTFLKDIEIFYNESFYNLFFNSENDENDENKTKIKLIQLTELLTSISTELRIIPNIDYYVKSFVEKINIFEHNELFLDFLKSKQYNSFLCILSTETDTFVFLIYVNKDIKYANIVYNNNYDIILDKINLGFYFLKAQ
jgi:hypothetical protein